MSACFIAEWTQIVYDEINQMFVFVRWMAWHEGPLKGLFPIAAGSATRGGGSVA